MGARAGLEARDEANQFAAELLMPAAWVREAVSNTRLDPADDEELRQLAEEFEVSDLATSYRLANSLLSECA